MLKLRILPFLFAILIGSSVSAQYIANPDFENYSSCPTGLSQTAKATPWFQPGGGSSDFYNCSFYGTGPIAGTPHSGDGVIGQWCYPGFSTSCPSQAYIEYVAAPLDSPLVANQTYCGSVSVMIDAVGTYQTIPNPCLDYGVYFYDSGNPPVYTSFCSATNIAPQFLVSMDTLLQGTYMTFEYSFVANGGEDMVLVGAFDNNNTSGCNNSNRMYANMDSLTLTLCSNLSAGFSASSFCEGDSTCFTNNTIGSYDTLIWTFGDPTTGPADTSHLDNPCHLYSDSGIYTVTLMAGDTASGNWDTITQTITIIPQPIAILGNDTSVCSGDTPILLGEDNEGYTYLWNTGDTTQTISVDSAGQYFIQVDNNGCVAHDTIVLGVIQYNLSLISDTTLCEGENIVLDAGYAEQYQWSNNETTQNIIVDLPGEYYVVGQDSNGCVASDTVNVDYSILTLELGEDQYKCTEDKVTLDAGTSGSTYQWSSGETTQIINVATPDVYYVTITDGGRCEKTDSIEVFKAETPFVALDPQPGECASVVLDAGGNDRTYEWSTGETTKEIEVFEDGIYWVVVDNGQCTNTDTVDVSIEYIPEIPVYPNVFTPNNDGLNDVFEFGFNKATSFDLKIYNRWGNIVFESNNPDKKWTGKDAPQGVYYWSLVYVPNCETETITREGYVTLLR